MTALRFLLLILPMYTVGSPLSAQSSRRTRDHGDVFFGMTKNREANPLDTPIYMKRPTSSLLKFKFTGSMPLGMAGAMAQQAFVKDNVSLISTKVHKNGSFSSENVISWREILRLLETTPSNEDQPSYDVPHITTFKTSALSMDAHDLFHFKKISSPELKRQIGNFVETIYSEAFYPERVLLSAWNQYGCSEEGEDATQDVYTFQCVVASSGSESYVMFIYDGTDLCEEDTGNQDRKDFHFLENEFTPSNNPGVITNLSTGDFTKSRKNTEVVDAPSKQNFYQLMSEDGKCLTLSYEDGAISECTDDSGEVAPSTVFRITGAPGNQKVEVFGTGKCLDREHCHSSTSNLRYSDCDHCGAIHWDVRSDGTLREDEGNNCVYLVASTQKVMVHHSGDGCTAFKLRSLGDSVLMKSINFGDCLVGATFEECNDAPRFFVNGLSRHYQFQETESRDCIDREHCHTSRSNMRLFSCDHCGAIHWSIEDTEIGEDDMKNCVNRDGPALAFVKHCTDSWEKMTFEIVPSNTTFTLQMRDDTKENFLPNPIVQDYIEALHSSRIRGARLFRNGRTGTAILEIIHSVPSGQVFQVSSKVGTFRIEFWVARIITFTPFSDDLNPREILAELILNEGSIQEFNLRYGAVDSANRVFEEEDGLLSLFVTNNNDAEPAQVSHDVSLLKRIGDALDLLRWWHRPPNFHHQSYKQSYYTFSSKRFYRALYWSNK